MITISYNPIQDMLMFQKVQNVTEYHPPSLTKRRHDMENSFWDVTSFESSTPLTYLTLNALAPNGQ